MGKLSVFRKLSVFGKLSVFVVCFWVELSCFGLKLRGLGSLGETDSWTDFTVLTSGLQKLSIHLYLRAPMHVVAIQKLAG